MLFYVVKNITDFKYLNIARKYNQIQNLKLKFAGEISPLNHSSYKRKLFTIVIGNFFFNRDMPILL